MWYVTKFIRDHTWALIIWIMNGDLTMIYIGNPFEKFSKEIYVRSDTTQWKGWTKIRE